ncbi:hypothetical protein D9757_000528 [Collybiopsis confluens]|uniref:REJ domain-containing protein n=1 Tax=Collybiopsis confluens TaxID=2823264 RepID=A0A8H5I1L4_9AGAR|nr:hypothetical protein D9757_000528 [Collybiopsis confluens]
MFAPRVDSGRWQARADSTSTTAASSSTASTNSPSTTASSSRSVSSSTSSSSASSSASSSLSSTSTSLSSSASASSTQSSSTTSSASSTSATTSATNTPQPSSGSKLNIGAIVGGAVAGIVVLILLSIIFTAFRRRRHNTRKRPRGSVFLGNVDQRFLEQKPRSNVSSVHSSVPLLSVVSQGDPDLRQEQPAHYTDTPVESRLPSPYSNHGHDAVPETSQSYYEEGESRSGHSAYLPSPYSQLGHGDVSEEAVAGLPQAGSITASHNPLAHFYAPVAVRREILQ